MLMMRYQRVGRKNDPSFRIVVTDKRNGPKSGNAVDQVGSYHPKTKHLVLDADKVKKWLSQGVQPSPTLYNLLITNKVIEGKKVNVLSKKSPIIDEAKLKAEADAKAAAEAKAKAEAEKEASDAEVVAPVEESEAPAAEPEAEAAPESTEEKVAA